MEATESNAGECTSGGNEPTAITGPETALEDISKSSSQEQVFKTKGNKNRPTCGAISGHRKKCPRVSEGIKHLFHA